MIEVWPADVLDLALFDAGQGRQQGHSSVVSALIKQSRKLPGELYRSLTWDRGKELADHKRLALASDVEVYFCTLDRHGSEAPTRTPTACCASTCRREPTCPCTAKPSSAPLPDS